HANGHDAAVVVRVLVDEHGNYLRHKVISSTHPELKRRSDAYASQLVFTPAIRDGRAMRYWVNVPFYYGN
ncbi:MAG: energy transducer TonB, partial [Bacteroidota bacterium]